MMGKRIGFNIEKKSGKIIAAFVVILAFLCPLIISGNAMAAGNAQASDDASLNAALAGATGTAGSPYVIEITGSFSLTSAKTIGTGKYVKLVSSDGSTFTLTRGNTSVNMFDVQGSLDIENIIIDGASSNTVKNIVRVSSGAAFTMGAGSVLQKASLTSESGGGAVYNQGTFNLNGGVIMDNKVPTVSIFAPLTGGVIYNAGTFNMTAGSITGNQAVPSGIDVYSINGGMIYNGGGASFTMSGGMIGGDGADANTATARNSGVLNGGVVYNAGTFTMSGTALIDGNNSTEVTGTPPYGSVCGGAVYNSGTFTMTGSAEISGTNADIHDSDVYGIGVYSKGSGARFTIQNDAKISGNHGAAGVNDSSFNGGGVYNCDGSQFIMQDNAEISGNQLSSYSSSSGAGVYNKDAGSTFTMKDSAKICNNTISSSYDCFGGGVYNLDAAQFIFQSGTISGNTLTSTDHGSFGGGVYSYNNTTITMSGGTITGNSANASVAGSYCRGGGVFTSNATFNLSGGTISSNQANNTGGYSEGGGVFNWNIFNFTGGRLTGNTAKNGGGVCNYTTFNLSGSAQIDSNTATTEGGGVENTSGTFTMTGGSIADNTAPKGKGVLNAATFNMSGDASVNTNNGVYLNSGKVINVTADLNGTSPFAVITPPAYSAGSNVVTLAAGLSADAYDSQFGVAPNGATPWGLKANGQNLQLAPGEIYLDGQTGLDTNDGSTKATAVATFEKAKSLLGSPGTIYICGTVTIPSGNDSAYTWTLPAGQTIKRYKDPVTSTSDFEGVMVQVNGNLTLQDIIIDGGWDETSGTGVQATEPIIKESSTGNLIINAGAALQNNHIVISNSIEDHLGSGVQGWGSVTMNGGTVSGNQIQILSGTADSCGGAGIAMVAGTFTMTGGTISGNAVDSDYAFGGGVYVDSGSTFTMTGGTIGGSSAADVNSGNRGGGLYNAGTIDMSGGSISGNIAGNGDRLGGGVFNQSVFNLSGVASIGGNTALSGGGVYNLTGNFNITGSASIDGNTASISGGGVCSNSASQFEMNSGNISNNTAAIGGGIYVQSGTFTMITGSIASNSAMEGGGIYGDYSSTLNISGCTISGNSASSNGGGIVSISTINMSGGTITGNMASTGAGIYKYGGAFNMNGGALIAQNNPVYLDGTHITVTGALSNAPAAWVIPAAYPDFGGNVKVGAASYAGATGATVLSSLAPADSAYGLETSGNDVNLVKIKLDATITLSSASTAYTGSAISFSGVVTKPSDLDLSDLVFLYKPQAADDSAYTVSAPTNAGVYSVKAALIGHVKYNDTVSNVATFTISKATPVLSAFGDQQADYIGHDFAINAPTVTGIGGSDISGQGALTYAYKPQTASDWTNGLPKNAGVYNVKATYDGNPNYAAASVTNTVTIRKLALTATADNYSRSFGQPNPAFTIAYSGFINSENTSAITPPTASTTATSVSDAGTYSITLNGGSAANYNITRVPGMLTVGMAAPVITFNDQSAAYSGKPFDIIAPAITENGIDLGAYGTLSYAYKLHSASDWTDGLPRNAGAYDVKATFIGNANVSDGTAVCAVTIRKAALTAAANNMTKVVGTENPALTIAYGGFVNNEGVSALDTMPTASTTAAAESAVGDYPITVSGGSAANYSFIYVPGTLSVSQLPAAQRPVFTKNLSGEYTFYNHVFSCKLEAAANVSDNGVITYQWYQNTVRSTAGGSPIAGATGNSYTVPTDTQGSAYFYVVATNTLNHDANRTASATSNIVKVTVHPAVNTSTENNSPSPSATQSSNPAISGSGTVRGTTPTSSQASDNQGNIKVELLPATVETPEVTVADSEGLKDSALTQEDKATLQNGENITITLKVERVDGPVNLGDDTKVAGNMGGNTLGMYLNVELLKQIGEGQQQNILNTSKPIRIVLAVPPELLEEGRNYSVIRVHGDETTVLPDLDDDPATITIETDRFSTYALVYKDKLEIMPWLFWIILILVIVLVIIYLARKKRKRNSD